LTSAYLAQRLLLPAKCWKVPGHRIWLTSAYRLLLTPLAQLLLLPAKCWKVPDRIEHSISRSGGRKAYQIPVEAI